MKRKRGLIAVIVIVVIIVLLIAAYQLFRFPARFRNLSNQAS